MEREAKRIITWLNRHANRARQLGYDGEQRGCLTAIDWIENWLQKEGNTEIGAALAVSARSTAREDDATTPLAAIEQLSRVHELKTWPEPFAAVLAGTQCHEIRVNDRGFAVGDVLELREWHPGSGTLWVDGSRESKVIAQHYTGRSLRVRVTYLTPGGAWGLPAGLCVMSIQPLPPDGERGGEEG